MSHAPFQRVLIQKSSRVVVLTGAGISAESGIRTFRDANGLWEQHRIEEVASPEGWKKNPSLVWRFYSERRLQAATAQPNPAHLALAQLEKALKDNFFLCTQNVDSLHERAGSKQVVHMHGELGKSRCENDACQSEPFLDERAYFDELPFCACGAPVRPHIVWFGEVPFDMHRITRKVQACDLFVTIGSSGAVYPAAGLVDEIAYRRQSGESARALYVGLEKPQNASAFDEVYLGKAGEILPDLFEVE